MLQSIRSTAKSWVMGILFGLLILSFAIWGIGDIFRGGGRDTVIAEVGGQEIGARPFIREFQQEQQRIQARFGGQLEPDRMALGVLVANQMAERILLDLAARDLHLGLPDEAVAKAVRNDPSFQQGGSFSKALYQRSLDAAGMTAPTYEASLKRDMMHAQLVGAVTAVEAPPESLADRLFRFRSERRVAEILVVGNDTMTAGEPDQSALEAYHKAHTGDFMAPEFRALTAIVLRPEDMMAEIAVDDEALREEYEARKSEFGTPEKRIVEQMLFPDEASAKAAYELLKGGKSFAEVATETNNQQGDLSLGTLSREQLLPELAEAVFAVPKDGYTAPLKSPFGWHILRVTEIQPGESKTFDEVKDKLGDTLKRDRALDALYELINAVEDELGGGATLEEAGRKLNVKVVKAAAVAADGTGPDGKPVPGLPAAPEFLDTAFATDEGVESHLVESNDGTAFIVRVDKVTPPALKPLEEVRAKAIASWKAEERRQAAKAEAERLAELVRSGHEMSAVAAEAGRQLGTTKPFDRQGTGIDESLPPDGVAKVFAAREGEAIVAERPDGYVVARVKQVLAADPKTAEEQRRQIAEDIGLGIASDLLYQYVAALRSRHTVDINRGAIEDALR